MHTVNIRNLFDLFGRKIAILGLLLLLTNLAEAQKFSGKGNYNFFDFQQKPYYFGITLGYNNSSFTPFRSKDFLQSDSIRVVESIIPP